MSITKKPYQEANDLYVSIDIETDGSLPGVNSMLSLGASAFDRDEIDVGTWYGKFTPIEGASRDLSTMEWWKGFPEAWAEANSDQVYWKLQIKDFVKWCTSICPPDGRVVLGAAPATFDGMFVTYYAALALGGFDNVPWKHRILDIRTYVHAVTKLGYHAAIGKKGFEIIRYEEANNPMPHHALYDAKEQAEQWKAARKFRKKSLYKKSEDWLIKPETTSPKGEKITTKEVITQ